ncbi:adenosine deaminase-like protein [Desarmillaria tabescens]|uniref:Adenosine deaminase-like protein n=1 Tax=Armillaria tabescens TaxID=1929756 RepID=A0AA39TW86_ARMTA|nr:adenosine deaminase-like protein [Desarmillaria tabescens]KAK0465134.1 adenosine deaminase-like protein [Desarmillaria tabescens]
MVTQVAGYALDAINSLTPQQLFFIQSLPKARGCMPTLNGSIPISGASHALVLAEFLDGDAPQCTYLELRSTPKETPAMTRMEYVKTVLDEDQAALIVSAGREMDEETVKECISIAKTLRAEGRRVVGVDLCGDPLRGGHAKSAGLGVTLHVAETKDNPHPETLKFLAIGPDRLGHATFLNDETQNIVLKENIAVELCLSSNLLCKTVGSLDVHHIRDYLKHDHPIAICTDDILPFRNSMLGEYALLMANAPLGLGLSEDDVRRIAEMSMKCRFT